ncbi:MAG: TonB-dependent receptor [Pseudomonadales bacterium]
MSALLEYPRLVPLSLAAALLQIAPTALAQQDNRATTLEEVIVTAQKREQSLQDAPISISAFSAGDIEKLGAVQPGDITNYVPNVQIAKQTGSTDNYSYSIRGAAAGETSLLNEQTVGLYIDGVYVARNTGAATDVADLERIEILRGPQGTLYGRNTIGGAINMITAKPAGEFAFKQELSFGNRGRLRWRSVLDTPKLGDVASAKISYLHSELDGLARNSFNGDLLGDEDSDSVRLALRFDVNEATTIDYTLSDSTSEGRGNLAQISAIRPGTIALAGPAFEQAANSLTSQERSGQLRQGFAEPEETDIQAHALTLTWAGENVTFKSVTSYREWESSAPSIDFGTIDADGSTVFDGMFAAFPAGTPVPLFQAGRESDSEQTTQEFQFVGNALDDKLQYVAGLYYFKEEVSEDNPQQFLLATPFIILGALDQLGDPGLQALLCGDPGATFGTNTNFGVELANACFGTSFLAAAPVFVYGSTSESYAAYGQFTYSLSEKLDLTLGLRYTIDEKDAFLFNSQIGGGLTRVTDSEDFDNISPAFVADYQWNEDISTYFKFATGYRAGGYNARVSTQAQFEEPYDEETLTSYEFGFKTTWFDQRVRINGALFFNDYQDQQISQFAAGSGGASSIIVNAGESETTGFELEIVAIPVAGLTLMLNYGYLDSEFKEYIGGPLDPLTGSADPTVDPSILDASGNTDLVSLDRVTVPQTAENSGSVIVEYEFPATRMGIFAARVDATYTDGFVANPVLNLGNAIGDQHTVNARLSLSEIPLGDAGDLRLALWGKNITNEKERGFGIDFGALGFSVNSYNELASWGLDVIYEY